MIKFKVSWLLTIALASVLSVSGIGSVTASSCTPGTDCYCDKVNGIGTLGHADPLYNPSVILCQDWEAPTLRNNQGFGNGAPYYGPWYDDTGLTGDRGVNSYFSHWGNNNEAGSTIWQSGQPSPPVNGTVCGFGACNGVRVWDSQHRWGSTGGPSVDLPCIGVFAASSDFQADVSSILSPTNTKSGVAGIFDGNANIGWRTPAGLGNVCGIMAFPQWTAAVNLGITLAIAYPQNIGITCIFCGPWKHHEFSSVAVPNGGFDSIASSWNGGCPAADQPCYDANTNSVNQVWERNPQTNALQQVLNAPFRHFIFYNPVGTASGALCQSAIAAANIRKGAISCNPDTAMYFFADPVVYSQPRDWPFGTWGCVRAQFANLNSTTSMSVKVWVRGPGMTQDLLIIDFDGLNGSFLESFQGYNGVQINNYANQNSGGSGATGTTATAYRWDDNITVTNAAPVTCDSIGFGGSGGPTPPAAPQNFTVQ